MQIKIKMDADTIYKQINWISTSLTSEELEAIQFIKENIEKMVFVHQKIWDQKLEVSKYENWKKYILPYECFELESIQEQDEIEEDANIKNIFWSIKEFVIDHKRDFAIWFVFILLLIIAIAIQHNKPQKIQQEPQKTAIQLLVEKQTLNINKIWAKMETQKILKWQIKELQDKLDENIKEVKAMELENSTIREKMIDETSNFNTKK